MPTIGKWKEVLRPMYQSLNLQELGQLFEDEGPKECPVCGETTGKRIDTVLIYRRGTCSTCLSFIQAITEVTKARGGNTDVNQRRWDVIFRLIEMNWPNIFGEE